MPHTATRWLILQKARRHSILQLLRLLVGTRFQVLFHSPLGVLFTFPSRYWFAIGHKRVFSLGGWSPLIHTGFHVSGITRVLNAQVLWFCIRGFYPLWPAFPYRFATTTLCNCVQESRLLNKFNPTTPHAATPYRLHVHGFRLIPFRSPLLWESRLIFIPPGT